MDQASPAGADLLTPLWLLLWELFAPNKIRRNAVNSYRATSEIAHPALQLILRFWPTTGKKSVFFTVLKLILTLFFAGYNNHAYIIIKA